MLTDTILSLVMFGIFEICVNFGEESGKKFYANLYANPTQICVKTYNNLHQFITPFCKICVNRKIEKVR